MNRGMRHELHDRADELRSFCNGINDVRSQETNEEARDILSAAVNNCEDAISLLMKAVEIEDDTLQPKAVRRPRKRDQPSDPEDLREDP